MRTVPLCLVALAAPTAFGTPSWPTDAALELWPEPLTVIYPTAPLGPHVMPDTAAVKVDDSCGADGYVAALVKEALTLKTVHTSSPRSYNGGAYEQADSYCSNATKCNDDAACGAGKKCVAPDALRWNSTMMCPPSAKYGHPCGCCVATSTPQIATISVTCNDASLAVEGYELDVKADGVAIRAATPRGAAWGVATLSQVMRYDIGQEAYMVDFVPLAVADAPRFEYRGVMLDTSRHFIPVDDILRYIDVAHAMKLTTFHWHIIDSPSFPYGSELYPELAKEGSWGGRAEFIYSMDDMKKVVQRGRERFVDVVFELDTPAHTMAMGKSHPEIMTDCWEWMANSGYKVDVDSDDCQAINPIAPAARTLVTNLITEAAKLTNSKYIHLGGDEVKYPCWDSDPAIKAHVADHYNGNYAYLQAEWTANVSFAAAKAQGKTGVTWQPSTDVNNPAWVNALPQDTVYMVWLSDASTVDYVKQGKKVVSTMGFYVDGSGPGHWAAVRNHKIIPDGLTKEEASNIIGASVCAWGELQATPTATLNMVTIAGGAAESFWRVPDNTADALTISQRYNRFLCHLQRYHPMAGQLRPSNCHIVKGL